MPHKLKSDQLDELFKAMQTLEKEEEFYNFFDDLCTISEIQAMGQRFAVAVMLYEGKTYQQIIEKTGASAATISRVQKCLNYGSDGYQTAIKRLGKNKGI